MESTRACSLGALRDADVPEYDRDIVVSLRSAIPMHVAAWALTLSACVTPTATSTATPSSTAVSATPSPTPGASQPASTTSPSSIVVTAVGAIPRRFRYAVLSWATTRVWLVDLEARSVPRLAIRLEHMGNGELSASSNGEVIALSASGANGGPAIHIVRPTTGTRTVVFDEASAQVAGTPIVTRAGDRYAFAKQQAGVNGFPGGSSDLGLWIGGTDGTAPRRVVAGGANAPSVPIEWSPDGRSLALVRGGDIFVLAPDGTEQRAGAGIDASWLSNTTLLIARGPSATPGIDRYEVGGAAREELRTNARVTWVRADPTGRRYAYIERTGTEDLLTPGTVWVRDAVGGAPRNLGAHRLSDIDWSSDGVALTGLSGGDDSVTGVGDLFGGPGAALCRRSDFLPQTSPGGGCV